MVDNAGTAFTAALAHHEAGRLEEARAGYGAILARDPDHVESLHLLGLITAQRGDPDTAVTMILRAIALFPGRAPHHNSLGLAYRIQGSDADAVREYEAAAALRPGSAEILNNLAATLCDLGRYEEAVERYRLAAECAPDVAEIWYNLASTLADRGPAAEVEACFRRAIGLRAEFVNAIANFGRWLVGQGRWIEADSWLTEAVRLDPGDSRSWNNLGIARQELGRTETATACYHRAIAHDPGFADAHYNLGCLLSGEALPDEALVCHAAAVAADPLHGAARLAQCTAWLPIVYRAEAEATHRRKQYLAALDGLIDSVTAPDVRRAVAGAIGTSQSFFLPYQGKNDREAQATLGGLACRLVTETESTVSLAPRPGPGERIRIGIVSGFFQEHTIFKLFLEGWMTELDRDRFEVIGFHTGRTSDAETARAARLCDRFVQNLGSVATWRDAVAEASPHVLLYPEIGMDPIAGALAARRLAPVQCVAWGHPETTGMPTMDYFLSADLMEPADGETYYTERLVRLPGLGVHFTPDGQELAPIDVTSPGTVPVYWSGQALYKYPPRHDSIFPRIAAAVGRCQFVFVGFAKSPAVTAIFSERLNRAFADFGLDADQYCVMLPPMPPGRFIAEMGRADVVLDTLDWSGGRSTLDCLSRDPAIVTLPGQFMRGRHTAAILRRIGCEETIAATLDDYVAIAARLGVDAAWRARVRNAVAEGKHRAFRDTAPVRALETFLTNAVTSHFDQAERAGQIAPVGMFCRAPDQETG
jgi:protein O-GlcNAc transferase